ncbi:RNA polymerase sigma factor [Spirosoma soli]|uniref:RNA polymerase sigma factor n=1 Tax=Spirosoma soli TaxID=1770529 RepID=A0ABW5LYD9_9BACT
MEVYNDCSVQERQWLDGCRHKDPRAQEKLFKHFYGLVTGICLRYAPSRHQAQEIVNDSFLKVFERIPHEENLLNFRCWLRRLVVNTALDHYRKEKRYSLAESLDNLDEHLPANDAIFDQLSAEELLRLLNQLPNQHRLVFNLYEIEGYSHDEIGTMMGIPAGSSRMYLSRAKNRLRKLVQSDDLRTR